MDPDTIRGIIAVAQRARNEAFWKHMEEIWLLVRRLFGRVLRKSS